LIVCAFGAGCAEAPQEDATALGAGHADAIDDLFKGLEPNEYDAKSATFSGQSRTVGNGTPSYGKLSIDITSYGPRNAAIPDRLMITVSFKDDDPKAEAPDYVFGTNNRFGSYVLLVPKNVFIDPEKYSEMHPWKSGGGIEAWFDRRSRTVHLKDVERVAVQFVLGGTTDGTTLTKAEVNMEPASRVLRKYTKATATSLVREDPSKRNK
jgi:hypothetical protein